MKINKNDLTKTIFDKSHSGRGSFSNIVNNSIISDTELPKKYLRNSDTCFPDISERDLVQHYSFLASKTYSVDMNFYPLGSCTMKYNPKINETISSLDGFINSHPLSNNEDIQGSLELLYHFERDLSAICGMDNFTLQPAAGAHGELTALFIAKKYFNSLNQKRLKVVVPDSSHGTNPASAAIAGFEIVTIPSNNGEVDISALEKECNSNLAVFMLTNPNTLGIFESNVKQICDLVHKCGGLTYMDGANLNALLGLARPGDLGFDMMHVNLHKTFSTPHGAGGPGSGPVGVKKHLSKFLPVPSIEKEQDKFFLNYKNTDSIGSVKSFFGNFGVIVRAAVYLDSIGYLGLKETSQSAIIAANYLKKKLSEFFNIPYNKICMHEFVMNPDSNKCPSKTLDIAKRLLDYGVHSPTIYFPLIVKEAIMIEPTETESKSSLDEFVEIMQEIVNESKENPDFIHNSPHTTYRSRMDEVEAARNPILKWQK